MKKLGIKCAAQPERLSKTQFSFCSSGSSSLARVLSFILLVGHCESLLERRPSAYSVFFAAVPAATETVTNVSKEDQGCTMPGGRAVPLSASPGRLPHKGLGQRTRGYEFFPSEETYNQPLRLASILFFF